MGDGKSTVQREIGEREKEEKEEGKRKHLLLAMQCRVSQAESEVVRLAAWRRHRGRGKYPLSPYFPCLIIAFQ